VDKVEEISPFKGDDVLSKKLQVGLDFARKSVQYFVLTMLFQTQAGVTS